MQEPQHLKPLQKLQIAILFAKIMSRVMRQDSTALQIEDMLIQSFEELHLSAQSIHLFKDRLEQVRQSAPHAHLEDNYVMGGLLVYCGILLPTLLSVGIPDLPARFAWIAFTIAFPSTIGFFLTLFLKQKNSIQSHGWLHGNLAFLAEIGAIATTAGLIFHVWNVAGWVFLCWTLVIFLGFYSYRFRIYFVPFLGIFKDILKDINDTASSAGVQAQETMK